MTPQRSFTIEVLGAGDVATLRAMLDVFGRAFDEPQTYTGAQPGDDYLRQLLSRDSFVAVAALQGRQVIGGIAAYILPKFEQQCSELYLYDLAVEQAHRRRGVATAMIEALKGVAASCGAYVIFVQADHGDDAAIALYDKLGIREEVLHFDILPGQAN